MQYRVEEDFCYGCLRALRLSDAQPMLEWMHDEESRSVFQADFASMTIADVERFIRVSHEPGNDLHFAIADDEGEYLGTVSLKRIDAINGNAEYAISTRRKSRGSGFALAATRDVISYAFDELGLHRVYLNVLSTNARAVRFYEKAGFEYEGCSVEHLWHNESYCDLLWYAIVASREPHTD